MITTPSTEPRKTTSNPTYAQAVKEMRQLLTGMKKSLEPKAFDENKVARTDVRIGHLGLQAVDRFVIHFRSTGCLWDKQAGGCSMCGFWNETAQFKRPITAQNFLTQFENALAQYDLTKYPVLSLYNAGSFLAEEEIPFTAVENIFATITKKLPDLKRVIIESKVEYVEKEKLQALQKILGSQTQLALAVGFESQDDTVRNLCINKGCTKKQFEGVIEMTKSIDAHSIVYIILKPPFLTEREAIEEAVTSSNYVRQVGVSEQNFETMTVESDTFISMLYNKGLYRLPWLWSVAEILKRVRPTATPFLTPMRYIADSVVTPHNCPKCTKEMVDQVYNKYCADFEVAHFDHLECTCKSEWQKEVDTKDPRSIPERVVQLLALLRDKPPISVS